VLVVLNRVVALGSQDEVCGDELGTLVEQLVKRVLGVGGRLAKENGSGGVLDVVSAACDGLSVRLHGQLLEVSREPVEVLVEAVKLSETNCSCYPSLLTERQGASGHRRSLSTRRSTDHR
jgi:hypothetical protein